jgi:deoxyribonuclease-1
MNTASSTLLSILAIGGAVCCATVEKTHPDHPSNNSVTHTATESESQSDHECNGFPQINWGFSTAKKKALNIVYKDHHTTLYCGCGFDDSKALDPSECGYQPRNDNVRAHRIEWEHIVPASRFGQHLECWHTGHELCVKSDGTTYKGRKCCSKKGVDDRFRKMEADLHNLAPAIGELNADRSNHPFGDIPGEDRLYGACDFEVKNGVAEPAESIRGDVARVYLYMADVHGMELSQTDRARFMQWHQADPPDEWERERNRRIKGIQCSGNLLNRKMTLSFSNLRR